jgi:phospholipid N-methyltransferase
MSTVQFVRDVMSRPLEMGAILPSSQFLARAMVDAAEIQPRHRVLELGAGSGAFTREISDRHPSADLILVEPGASLAEGLRREFPRARVCAILAQDLGDVGLAPGSIDRVVSGLPWALWSGEVQSQILDALVPLLAPHARLVTFHYLHSRALGRVASFRELLSTRFRRVTHTAPVWANMPPAYVRVTEGLR